MVDYFMKPEVNESMSQVWVGETVFLIFTGNHSFVNDVHGVSGVVYTSCIVLYKVYWHGYMLYLNHPCMCNGHIASTNPLGLMATQVLYVIPLCCNVLMSYLTVTAFVHFFTLKLPIQPSK